MLKDNAVVVKCAPDQYPRQVGLTCGEVNARAILAGFGIRYQAPSRLRLRIRLFGYSFIEDIVRLLQAHGLAAPVRYAARLSDEAKLRTIIENIDQGRPVLAAIGNGHLRRGVFSPLARTLVGHYITIYGYNEAKARFYVYDPYLEGPYRQPIPVGNEVRTFTEFLRDWRGPFYYPFIRMDHAYIPVGPPAESRLI